MMDKMDRVLSLTVDWFRQNRVPLPWRKNRDPYRIWISEIMLQQTRIETVIPYYHRFLSALPDVFALAACPEERLLKLWEGLGYYSRARNLKKCAQLLCRDHQGLFPRTARELERLPGIGAYTAGAIASIAFGEPAPAVDGNVLRVLTRVLALEDDIAKPATREKIAALLSAHYPRGDAAGDATQGLMEIGETRCIPGGAPLCASCPLAGECEAGQRGLWDRIPHKSPKKERRVEEKTVFLLEAAGAFALEKRGEAGLLAGLFGFPMANGHLEEQEARAFLEGLGFSVLALSPCGSAKHVFTHVEWQMRGIHARVEQPLPPFLWETPARIREEMALPSAFRAFRKKL